MKVVSNGIVKMQWNADGFIESKKQGFISAVHNYEDENGGMVAVAFKDGICYALMNEEESGAIPFADLVSAIKQAAKTNDCNFPDYYEDFIPLISGGEFEDGNMDFLGICSDEIKQDIRERLDDLYPYWEIIEVDMVQQ